MQNQKEDLKNQIEKLKKNRPAKDCRNNNYRLDNLQRQKEDLKDQMEKLKKIDLGIEDKKRVDLSNEVDKKK